jgi:hypothetical protein
MLVILLILAIAGAVADWKYKKRGGTPSTFKDRLYFGIACGLCAAMFVILAISGGGAEAAGSLAALVGALLFVLWEAGRWRTRRKNPLPQSLPEGPQTGIIYTQSELDDFKRRGLQ